MFWLPLKMLTAGLISMDFEEFKSWRDAALQNIDVPSSHRFDCLNPFKAMQFMRQWKEPSGEDTCDPETAIDVWSRLHLGKRPMEGIGVEVTRGVRSALEILFDRVAAEGLELWLPEDVYPFYRQAALKRVSEHKIRYFSTFPDFDLAKLKGASERAVLLTTDPLSPSGSYLSPGARRAIREWTLQHPDRWAFFDAVYHYGNTLPEEFLNELRHGRCSYLFSLSKSWLLRGVFGSVVSPASSPEWSKDLGLVPAGEACGAAKAAMTTDAEMPARQQYIFRKQWSRDLPIKKYPRSAVPVNTGYFKPVAVNFEEAFKQDRILLVPASIFGNKDKNLSIATCLYDAAAAQGVRVAAGRS